MQPGNSDNWMKARAIEKHVQLENQATGKPINEEQEQRENQAVEDQVVGKPGQLK